MSVGNRIVPHSVPDCQEVTVNAPPSKIGRSPPAPVEPYPNILGGNAWTLASYTYICTQSLAY